MKLSSNLIKLLLLSMVGVSSNLYAQNRDVEKVSSIETIKKDQPIIKNNDENNNELLLTVESLDKSWANREAEDEQEKILNFIQNEPEVPEDFSIAWRVARLVYFSGNFGIGEKLPNDVRVKMFLYGYKTAEIAKRLNPARVEGYYWYAVDLGSYGLAKGVFSALNNAPIGRDALLQAAKIDPSYQWGGPYRVLGRYYQEVPRIISFGDKKKAEEYFKKAIQIAPNFRLNTIDLGILF